MPKRKRKKVKAKGSKGAKRDAIMEAAEEDAKKEKTPKSFLFRKGQVPAPLRALISDSRHIFLPFTALRLQEKKTNKLHDFVNIAGQLSVSHFLMFSFSAANNSYLRVAKVPHGPTFTFRLTKYALCKDVAASQKNPHSRGSEYHTPPLLVVTNFVSKEKHVTLMNSMFRSLFPSININKINLKECRRVVLIDYNEETSLVEWRHYLITIVPHGTSKSIKRVLNAKSTLPELSTYEDISEYVLNGAKASESDVEDAESNARVRLPQNYTGARNQNRANNLSAVRLVEIGPRMQLRLERIEEGLCEGIVLYNRPKEKQEEEEEEEENDGEDEVTMDPEEKESAVATEIDDDEEQALEQALEQAQAQEQAVSQSPKLSPKKKSKSKRKRNNNSGSSLVSQQKKKRKVTS